MTDSEAKGRILVVDDDASREDLAELLRMEGFEVSTARDAAAGMSAIESDDVDLVLLDIVMPKTSGLDLLRRLRERYSPADVAIVMMSAKDQSTDVVEALESGANDYVTKPLDFPVLLARVQAQLRVKRAAGGRYRNGVGRPATGGLLAGRYRLGERLGEGSFGVVYAGRDEESGEAVAIKVLHQGLATGSHGVERLSRESAATRRLRHRHAVTVKDFQADAGAPPFLVMELLDGHSLDRELVEKGPLAPERAVGILLPVCEVLAAAHGLGIVHRDVKPPNVFLHRAHGEEVVKVLDFGIAKPLGDLALSQNLTVEGSVLGSPAYMAPERLRNRAYDGRADVYSLGVMAYEMLTGRLPFRADHDDPLAVVAMHLNDEPPPPSRWVEGLPTELEEVVLQTLRKDPKERPAVTQVGRDLAAAVGLPVPQGLLPDHLRTLVFPGQRP